jgi:hypothetical protein
MTVAKDPETERQEREAERLALVRRQNAALLSVVRRQTDRVTAPDVSTALPDEERKTSAN